MILQFSKITRDYEFLRKKPERCYSNESKKRYETHVAETTDDDDDDDDVIATRSTRPIGGLRSPWTAGYGHLLQGKEHRPPIFSAKRGIKTF